VKRFYLFWVKLLQDLYNSKAGDAIKIERIDSTGFWFHDRLDEYHYIEVMEEGVIYSFMEPFTEPFEDYEIAF
jgi:hypothetical protein